jgi:hypothetical protein
VPQPVPDYAAALTGDIKGLKLGLPKEYMIGGLDAEVGAAVDAAVKQFEKLGAEIVEISLPHTDYAVATYYIIATAEASANLARFDGIRYGARVDGADPIDLYCKTRGAGFGAEVKRRIILGTYVLSSGYYDAYYLRAQKVRTLIRNDFLKAFEKWMPSSRRPRRRRLQDRRKIGRPVANVFVRHFHDFLQPGGHLRREPALRFHREPEAAHRPATARQAVRRGNHPAKLAHAYEQSTSHEKPFFSDRSPRSWLACGRLLARRKREAAGVPVLVAKAVATNVPVQIDPPPVGHVMAISTVTVHSQIGGIISEVHFKEGQEVKKGDLLFTIDPRPSQAALDSGARESLESATRHSWNTPKGQFFARAKIVRPKIDFAG